MKIFIVILLIIVFSCTEENKSLDKMSADSGQVRHISSSIPGISKEYLFELFDLQQKINLNPTNVDYRKDFISKSYFPQYSSLITFGCARRTNLQTGQTIPEQMMKRATVIDALRWAAYSELWIKEDSKPDYGKLNTGFTRNSKKLFSFTHGDSLVIAYTHKIK